LKLGFSLLCTFNNLSLKCNTLHARRGLWLHASVLVQKLSAVTSEPSKPCRLLVSVSDNLSVPSLYNLCTQKVRFHCNQRFHGNLAEEFEGYLPPQIAKIVTKEYTHLRPNKLQVLVPEPSWTCLCVHRYSCCQQTREHPRCCIEELCQISHDGTVMLNCLQGLRL